MYDHIVWGYSRKHRPDKIDQKYMESVPPIFIGSCCMAIE